MKHSLNSQGVVRVLSSAAPIRSKSLSVSALPSDDLKIGFSVGRWCGSAVKRNQFKRKARCIIRSFHNNKPSCELVVSLKSSIHAISFLEKEIHAVLSKIHKTNTTYGRK